VPFLTQIKLERFMAEPTPDVSVHLDPHAGQAGTFIFDPLTGNRISADQYQPPEPSPAPNPAKSPIAEDKI
jgi:hypothetical protein